jgi:hypothetical protein
MEAEWNTRSGWRFGEYPATHRPRIGVAPTGCTNVIVKRNYSHHVYVGGWSQGANFEIFDTAASTIEHNVIYDSSWPVRGGGAGTEFRYNLVLMAGHEWMQPNAGIAVHHNLFVGGDEDQGGLFVYNSEAAPNAPVIDIYNNTLDGMAGTGIMAAIRLGSTAGPTRINSNAFLNYPKGQVVLIEGGSVDADYNGFFASQATAYSDGRQPAHDLSGSTIPMVSPPQVPFTFDEGALWLRTTTVANVLASYRASYAPKPDGSLLGAGDSKSVAANWMGAIGAGQADTDRFGRP